MYSNEEKFFFTVSKCNPKCSGGFYGKPATFQFSPLTTQGTDCSNENCGYGMVCNCKYPECKNVVYGGAKFLPGVWK